ncbi:MAG: RNA polymerase sigma factor [Kofleriaceae bacterium]
MVDERELCVQYAPRIRAYGLRHLRDASAADDLVQHVLLAVVRALRDGRIEDTSRIGAYILGTARNAAKDLRRGELRQQRIADADAATAIDSYLPSHAGVDRLRLEACLGELEPRDITIVLASFVEERDADEIGGALQLTAGNVRVIRHRALARLQTCIERCA